MPNLIDTILKATDLNDLCEILNNATDEDMETIDTSSLPTFGGKDVEDTLDVWSWDADSVLLVQNEWYVEARCSKCGEADFNCDCDNE